MSNGNNPKPDITFPSPGREHIEKSLPESLPDYPYTPDPPDPTPPDPVEPDPTPDPPANED